MCIVVDRKDNLVGRQGKADAVERAEGRNPGCAKARYAGFHRGLRAGHGGTGRTWELGRATRLLGQHAGRRGVPADQEPRRWQTASGCYRARTGTQTREQPRYRGASGSEAARDRHGAVVAERSTGEGGEVRPKRPTGGKARPGRARDWEERREGLRAYQPSQQNPGHRRGAVQLCASGPGQPTGHPDRRGGLDTDEPDELVAHVRD
jgi:hypothetical protein